MGIFSKKYDIEKSPLRIEFNYETKSYDTYYGYDFIPYKKLNRKSKRMIDEKNRLLEDNPQILAKEMEEAKVKLRYDKLKSLGYSCHSFECLGRTDDGTMSKQMETLLNSLVNEENVLLCIHRIGSDDSPQKIEDILRNGLIMTDI